MTISEINRIETAIFAYKWKFSLLPTLFDRFFSLRSDTHSRQTRSAQTFNLIKCRTETRKRSLAFRAAALLNRIYELNVITFSTIIPHAQRQGPLVLPWAASDGYNAKKGSKHKKGLIDRCGEYIFNISTTTDYMSIHVPREALLPKDIIQKEEKEGEERREKQNLTTLNVIRNIRQAPKIKQNYDLKHAVAEVDFDRNYFVAGFKKELQARRPDRRKRVPIDRNICYTVH
ncbi:hypothetical protein CAPTEDRAFT_193897 [Capitella teleta]|uniref:Uncharacterized protein n=1 Tax=Capitella teleta TaxID=283909 RepID=R7UYS5_CAPTE|nr:hypothetical protein CAPTEDRAFT_193897 [Capitella teleta]|eukprot:ELU11489.1 hypothetical protein CAPTEDRAFT_193897 [Capitella teleta]